MSSFYMPPFPAQSQECSRVCSVSHPPGLSHRQGTPLPPGFCDLCFQYFARKIFKTLELHSSPSLYFSMGCGISGKVFILLEIMQPIAGK
jgi:hypothetical protein